MPSTLSDRLSREHLGVFLGGEAVHVFRAVSEELPDVRVALCKQSGVCFVRPPQKVTQDGYLCQRCRRRLEGEEEVKQDG